VWRLDLSFARIDHGWRGAPAAAGFTVLIAGAAARQAASPTARMALRLAMPVPAAALLAPPLGAFNVATAALLTAWKPV